MKGCEHATDHIRQGQSVSHTQPPRTDGQFGIVPVQCLAISCNLRLVLAANNVVTCCLQPCGTWHIPRMVVVFPSTGISSLVALLGSSELLSGIHHFWPICKPCLQNLSARRSAAHSRLSPSFSLCGGIQLFEKE